MPPDSRDIEITRFVAPAVLGDQWFERPYYRGPGRRQRAPTSRSRKRLERKDVIGIARWVMRKKRYVGALSSVDGFLTMTTLRRADQVLSFSGIQPAKSVAPAGERAEAGSAAGLLDRSRFRSVAVAERIPSTPVQDDRSEGARREDQAGASPKKKRAPASLADSLRASIAAVKEKKVA